MMNTGEKIMQLRKDRKLSQEDLAEIVNVSRQAVSKWETGDAMPDTDKIVALADYFSVTTDWLLRGVAPQPDASCQQRDNLQRLSPVALCFCWLCAAQGLLLLLHGLFRSGSEWPTLLGLALQLASVILPIGYALSLGQDGQTRHFLRQFWKVNVWFVAPLPVRLLIECLVQLIYHIPDNILYWLNSTLPGAVCTFCRIVLFSLLPLSYVAVCLFVSLRICRKELATKE